ncbi:pectate lyase-like adhesive domain-containing protein [Lactobacillus sp. PV012]|uniref:pectate lyase-like adhesive domain-containing protein n=1 Tax=Lactobacillus sp. PV012 TaxID=2594494 RepID=UPI0022407151|nr:pectate lyase-like adhesive domain-containing protein [Lactobacillus sp. PV012]QNQ81686.1 hypothetical protein FP433_00785 [Lactobacillus sp. PV012]
MLSNKIVNFNQYKNQHSTNHILKVADFDQFTQALVNPNISKIIFVDNVSSATGQTALNENLFTGELSANTLNIFSNQYHNIARTLVIDLNNYELNLDHNYISFADRNYGDKAWNITLKNGELTANSEMNSSPFYFNNVSESNQAKTKFIFEDTVINLDGPEIFHGEFVDVYFAGESSFDVSLAKSGTKGFQSKYSNGLAVGNFFVKPNAEIMMRVNTPNYIGENFSDTHLEKNNNMIWLQGSNKKYGKTIIGAGAKVSLESTTADMRGIVSSNSHALVTLQKGAKLSLKLATGHSMAIATGDLLLEEEASLKVITSQDNNEQNLVNNILNIDDYHYAPISLGLHAEMTNRIHSLKLAEKASLKVIRRQVNSITPLISFGLGKSNEQQDYVLELGKDSSLELRDEAAVKNYLVMDQQKSCSGLITMYGTESRNRVIFNEPRYVSLQREGTFGGNLLKLEGSKNSIKLNGNRIDGMPASHYQITQTMSNGVQDNWEVADLITVDKLSSKVLVSPTKAGKGSFSYNDKKINTQAPYKTGGNYLAETKTLNDILEHFNWQTPNRLTFANYALENSKYIPQFETMVAVYNAAVPNISQTMAAITFVDKKKQNVTAPILNEKLGDGFVLGQGAPKNAIINAQTGAITITPTAAEVGKTVLVPVIVRFRDYSQLRIMVPITVIGVGEDRKKQLGKVSEQSEKIITFPTYIIRIEEKDDEKVA